MRALRLPPRPPQEVGSPLCFQVSGWCCPHGSGKNQQRQRQWGWKHHAPRAKIPKGMRKLNPLTLRRINTRDNASNFKYLFLKSAKGIKKNTFSIYINIKIVDVHFLLSQDESLKGWKQEIKNSLNSLKYYISAVFFLKPPESSLLLEQMLKLFFFSGWTQRWAQAGRRLGVVVAAVVHSRAGVRQHR